MSEAKPPGKGKDVNFKGEQSKPEIPEVVEHPEHMPVEGPGDLRALMKDSPSANLWGELEDGTNQGVKHFADYWDKYPERIPSLAERSGVDVNDFSNTVEGFENFTKQAMKVKDNGILREVNGKQIYFIEGAANPKKGIVVIFKDGKLQSMMPSDLKSFNKLN